MYFFFLRLDSCALQVDSDNRPSRFSLPAFGVPLDRFSGDEVSRSFFFTFLLFFNVGVSWSSGVGAIFTELL